MSAQMFLFSGKFIRETGTSRNSGTQNGTF